MSIKHSITLLRHAESIGNVQNLFIGQDDSPLTENGRRQAIALARRWAQEGVKFDRIITSPLSRAKDTAEIISIELGVPVQTDPSWIEQDFGEWNPISIPEIVHNPNTPKHYTPYDRPGKTGESRIETFIRAGQALQNLMDQPPGRALIVAHGVILNMALYFSFGIPCHPSAEGPWFTFHNTSFATLTYNHDRYRWHLLSLNDHRHLSNPPPINDQGSYQITFVRHAESEGNANGVWQGQADFPLSETGHLQAKILAEYLAQKGEYFDEIISSPLSRTQETANAIAEKLGGTIEIDPVWLERDNGLWAGTTEENRHPPEPDYHPLHDPVGKTGETHWELYLRGGQALASLFKRPPGRYLISSHGGILNMVLYAAMGITPFPNHQGVRFTLRNSSVTTIIYFPARNRWLVTGLNDLSHLESTKLDFTANVG